MEKMKLFVTGLGVAYFLRQWLDLLSSSMKNDKRKKVKFFVDIAFWVLYIVFWAFVIFS